MNTAKRNISAEDFFAQPSARERILFLLQYGVLAPSTHNSQPWNFKIDGESCTIIRNDDHPIVYADPQGRDLAISLGCLIENLVIAAKYFKVFKDVEYVGDGSIVARVNFANLQGEERGTDQQFKPLLDAILYRVTARGIFENEALDAKTKETLRQVDSPTGVALYLLEEKAQVIRIAELTQQGLRMAYKDPKFRNEMSQWFNSSFSGKPTGIPGYSVRMPAALSIVFPWLVRNFDIGKKLGVLNYESIRSAPAALVITAPKNSPEVWLDVGRYAERLMLQANALGYKTSIFTAAIEMGELYKDIQRLIGTDAIPQFIIIVGKLDFKQKPNLRISAQDKVIT